MKVAILETVKAAAGFELEFDRIIVEALKSAGHEPVLFVPEETQLDQDFHIPIIYLTGGTIVSYDGAHGLTKLWRSLQRERRRVRWFDDAVRQAKANGIGAILLTTATYRYLRSLQKSQMRYSSVPVYFIFLGVNPEEMPKFIQRAKQSLPYKNIYLRVTTLRDDFGSSRPENVKLIPPPIMVPGVCQDLLPAQGSLKIGFFGHYRKGEKNLEWILQAVQMAHFSRPVQFVLQLAPTTAEDQQEAAKIVAAYRNHPQIRFITRNLLGDDWYNAIRQIDAVLLPYTASRYLYNWSAIYFTAIGCCKPVLVTRVLNPEVMAAYKIGAFIDIEKLAVFSQQLEGFVNSYDKKNTGYKKELQRANQCYSKQSFIKNLLQ